MPSSRAAGRFAQQVDYALVRAEMNGFDFNVRVLKSWARDPAFYKSIWTEQSDTPAHEGPTHHGAVEVWTYSFPLTAATEAKLIAELRQVPPLLTPGTAQSHRQRARSVGHGNRDHAAAGEGSRRPRAEDRQRWRRAAARDRRGTQGNRRIHCVAGAAGAVQERAIRDRQGELHLEPAPRAPRAHDLGR